MSTRLHYTSVRPIAGRINKLLGVSASGAPIVKRGCWVVGALTLENAGYGTWTVSKVTSQRGGVVDLHRGKLKDCQAYLLGMEDALKLASPNLGENA